MFPSTLTMIGFIILACFIPFLSYRLPKRLGTALEMTLIIASLIYLFIYFRFTEAMIIVSFMAAAYGNAGIFFNKGKRKKRRQLLEKLQSIEYQKVEQSKDVKRLAVDISLTLIVSAGALLFLMFAPATYAVLKMVIGFGLISIFTQLAVRIGNFLSAKVYWLPTQERLVILSLFEPRDLPLWDTEKVSRETAPDLLRLHPLFTFISENQDYTTSFGSVLRLAFPGENIYLTPSEAEQWQKEFSRFMKDDGVGEAEEKSVLPLWHPQNMKRLFWKGYFAMTVKGISAYTGLLLILLWFDVPSYLIILFVFSWWVVNLYISDRVLIAGTDAEELTEGKLFNDAQTIFNKAGIPKTKLFIVDSPAHNGLATGMNIGRGTIMLTKATTQLSPDAVKAIVAHEAIHIKKRDVLINQFARMLFMLVAGSFIYLFFDDIKVIAQNHIVLWMISFQIMMLLFPMYLSAVSQWTEIRADFLGAGLLENGKSQMAEGLRELGYAQDKALDKTFEYSTLEEKPLKQTSETERDGWFFRAFEFQFQAHPPLYWRIQTLSSSLNWRSTLTTWLAERIKESLPDRLRKKSVATEKS